MSLCLFAPHVPEIQVPTHTHAICFKDGSIVYRARVYRSVKTIVLS
jgi:hypothetical protein